MGTSRPSTEYNKVKISAGTGIEFFKPKKRIHRPQQIFKGHNVELLPNQIAHPYLLNSQEQGSLTRSRVVDVKDDEDEEEEKGIKNDESSKKINILN